MDEMVERYEALMLCRELVAGIKFNGMSQLELTWGNTEEFIIVDYAADQVYIFQGKGLNAVVHEASRASSYHEFIDFLDALQPRYGA